MIITIARQCGCGALYVGRLLSQMYGIPFYTRKNIMEMAEKKGILKEMNDFFEEYPVNDLLYAFSDTLTSGRKKITEKSLNALSDIVGKESCIVVGRCGNYIFKNRNDLVSVFLHGDLDARIRNIMRENSMDWQKATEWVHYKDDCRTAYHKFYTGLTWGNAADYDLCLDCCRLGTQATARQISQYIEQLGLK